MNRVAWSVTPRTTYRVECWRGGVPLWAERFPNLVTTAGKNKLLDATFKTGQLAYAWYIGLVGSLGYTAYAAADTMASHAGWLESTPYSNAARPAFAPGAIADGRVSNTLIKALFTINATASLRGAFLVDVATKGGVTGTLYGVGDFAVNRSVLIGDVLYVTVTLGVS